MTDPLLFSLTVMAILATPGPTNTLLATSGALVGARRSLHLIAAELSGYLIAILALHHLLAGVIARHDWLAFGLRIAVATYLLFAAYELWTRRIAPGVREDGIRFARVFVTTLLNPKALVFAFGVIPLAGAAAAAYLGAFALFVVIAASSWIAAGALAGSVATGGASRTIPRISAVVIACFAGLIAVG